MKPSREASKAIFQDLSTTIQVSGSQDQGDRNTGSSDVRFYDPPTIAYFSFDRFFQRAEGNFENRAGNIGSKYLYPRTGSANGQSFRDKIGLTHSTLGFSGSFSNPRVPNTPTRVLTRRVQNVIDFDATNLGGIGDKFLLLESAAELNPAPAVDNGGRTFMVRCLIKDDGSSGGTRNNATILSIANVGTAVFSIYMEGNNLRAKLHGSSGTTGFTLLDMGTYLGQWVTVFCYASKTKVGPAAVFLNSTGERIATHDGLTELNAPTILSDPSLFVGYGAAGSAPNAAFPVADFLDYAQMAEVAVFDGQLSGSNGSTWQQMGWIANAHLSGRHISGFINLKPRRMIRDLERFPAYPTIARTGDERRLGNRKIAFDDTRTLIFTGSVLFPSMMPPGRLNDEYNNFSPIRGTPVSRKIEYDTYSLNPGGLPYFSGTFGPPRVLDVGILTSSVPGQELPLEEYVKYPPQIMKTPFSSEFVKVQRNAYHFIPPRSDISTAPEFLARETIEPFNESRLPQYLTHLSASELSQLKTTVGSATAVVIDLENSSDLSTGYGMKDEPDTVATAYYNFKSKKWESKAIIKHMPAVIDDARFQSQAGIDKGIAAALGASPIAFTGQAGFSIYPSQSNPLLPLQARARPTDFTGFPFSDAHKPDTGQKLKMSDYITEPFVVESVYFEIDGEIYEGGDESLGYINPSNVTEEQTWLERAYSCLKLPIHTPGGYDVGELFRGSYATFGRMGIMGGSDIMYVTASFSPLQSAITGPQTKGQMFMPSTGLNQVMVAMNGTSGSTTQQVLRNGQLNHHFSAAPYWRCDSFFILRERPGNYSKYTSVTTNPYSAVTNMVAGEDGDGTPLFGGANPAAPGFRKYQLQVDWKTTYHATSSITTRELVTYSQMTHRGYVRGYGPLVGNPMYNLLKKGEVTDYRQCYSFCDPVNVPKGNYADRGGFASGMIDMPAIFIDANEGDLLQHQDYLHYGTFDTPGTLTGKTLMEAGLSRDTNYLVAGNQWLFASPLNSDGTTAGIEVSASPDYGSSATSLTRNFPSAQLDPDNAKVVSSGPFKIFAPCRSPVRTGPFVGLRLGAESRSSADNNWKEQLFVNYAGVESDAQRQPEISSGRSFTRSVPGRIDTTQKLTRYGWNSPKGTAAVCGVSVGGGVPSANEHALTMWVDNITLPTGTLSKTYDQNSPYILYPEDEIIIGFAPSTPGHNEGTNRTMAPGLSNHVFDNINTSKNEEINKKYNRSSLDPMLSIFKLKKGAGKVILYGTTLSNNHKIPSELNQELTTLAASEPIGAKLRPSDQFLTAQEQEYVNSPLTQVITGSYYSTETGARPGEYSDPLSSNGVAFGAHPPFTLDFTPGPRGVAADFNRDSGLWITGSFKRFVDLYSPDLWYWDSAVPNIKEIWERDGKALEETGWGGNNTMQAATGPSSDAKESLGYWNRGWLTSFPFESKYRDIRRIDTDEENTFTFWNTSADPNLNDVFIYSFGNAGTGSYDLVHYTKNDFSGFLNKGLSENMASPNDVRQWSAAFFGFGTGRSGSLEGTCQPRESAPGAGTIASALYRAELQHPSGFKYGLKNISKERLSWKFRSDHFGHFRDMLEQPHDSVLGTDGDMFRADNPSDLSRGEMDENTYINARHPEDVPVYCKFYRFAVVNMEGELVPQPQGVRLAAEEHDQTTCNNLSTYATSSIPYIDGRTTSRNMGYFFRAQEADVTVSAPDLP